MADIALNTVTKRYPDGTEAVRQLDLHVDDGEFMILVGPSGCGKSTVLRMVAGLEDVSAGEVRIGGELVNEHAPKDRDVAMVFQNYALYPQMTVRRNMGFSLKLAKASRSASEAKVSDAAAILDLFEHLDRKPGSLSGGQRQRVAMGRAIVREPKAFLMDEPLSNLDAKLRVQMRASLARIQRQLGTTTVYVTHDQTEAMTLGDRVAVMRDGVLQQIGTPKAVYDVPANLFVAGFIGSPAMNFVPAVIAENRVHLPFAEVELPADRRQRLDGLRGAFHRVVAGVRPERFEDAALVDRAQGRVGVEFDANVELVEELGAEVLVHFPVSATVSSGELAALATHAGLDVGSGKVERVVARLSPESAAGAGQRCRLWLDATGLELFDAETGRNLLA